MNKGEEKGKIKVSNNKQQFRLFLGTRTVNRVLVRIVFVLAVAVFNGKVWAERERENQGSSIAHWLRAFHVVASLVFVVCRPRCVSARYADWDLGVGLQDPDIADQDQDIDD